MPVFAAIALLSILALLLITAEEWWPMGRQVLGTGLVLAAVAVGLRVADYLFVI